jgi:hypothetical protein
VRNDPHVERCDPDLWTDEFAYLDRLGNQTFRVICSMTIGLTLPPIPHGKPGFARFNLERLCYGGIRSVFNISKPEAYRRYLPKAVVQILEAGPYTLDTAADEIALHPRVHQVAEPR